MDAMAARPTTIEMKFAEQEEIKLSASPLQSHGSRVSRLVRPFQRPRRGPNDEPRAKNVLFESGLSQMAIDNVQHLECLECRQGMHIHDVMSYQHD